MSETVTILLVDPDAPARALLAKQLEGAGTDVLQASDGATALDLLESVPVKVVVTELYLPAGDHSCLVQAIRANPTCDARAPSRIRTAAFRPTANGR
jgi:CheY-like chemotaxis protein